LRTTTCLNTPCILTVLSLTIKTELMKEYLNNDKLRIYTSVNYPFLIIELKGILEPEDYIQLMQTKQVQEVIRFSGYTKVFLELKDYWSLGMEQQDWTSREFTRLIAGSGVSHLAIGVSKHMYPGFKPFWSLYERLASVNTRYVCNHSDAVSWLK